MCGGDARKDVTPSPEVNHTECAATPILLLHCTHAGKCAELEVTVGSCAVVGIHFKPLLETYFRFRTDLQQEEASVVS